MTTRKPWTDAENAACITLYFTMLDAAIDGTPYNKAAMIRDVQQHESDDGGPSYPGPLVARSRASIEFKLCNATACHASIIPGAVTMNGFGYRALGSYQKSLKSAMTAKLEKRRRSYADCKSCGLEYRHNNLDFHGAGYCSRECHRAAA